MSASTARTARDATAAQIANVLTESASPLVLVSHRNPDADALGSMLALHRALAGRGVASEMTHPDPEPVPSDLAFLLAPGEAIAPRLPDDLGERTLVAVDCASEQRLWDEPAHRSARRIVNLDHHQDNTRFGDLNLVEPLASSTAEVLVHVLEAAGWTITADVATPLYAALVTDTGRFGYANARAEAHRVAAVLIRAGADPAELARRLYEEQPLPRLLLLGRALAAAEPRLGGALLTSALSRDDFAAVGGDDSEGIVEVLRSARGVRVAALATERGPNGAWRVSLRSADDSIDVAEIAHHEGGGGHRAAAGFSTARPPDDLASWLEEVLRSRLEA